MAALLARMGLYMAIFLTVVPALMLLFLNPRTAEFVVTALTLGMGLFLALISSLALYRERKRL
ncbi:hypothetical protein AB0I28_00450 [Phytomonospora sp. NPDC050363]|uniref:hypothetical protein n=1 Tax=Phytomonospora sp. NPDC050363 TaxID=3155642 RepID=UPI0033EC873F